MYLICISQNPYSKLTKFNFKIIINFILLIIIENIVYFFFNLLNWIINLNLFILTFKIAFY